MTRHPQETVLTREYPPGAVIFEERDPGSRMYVIRKGRVKIYRTVGDAEVVLAFLGPGEFFGEMALLEELPRSASAMVVEPTTLIEVDAATFEAMIRRNTEIAARMLRKLASRVRELDTRLEQLLVDDAQHRALDVLFWLLPQGVSEDGWTRIPGAGHHLDIAAQAGVPDEQSESVVRRLREAGCMRSEGADLLVASRETLDAYASYLQLRRRYGDTAAETSGQVVSPAMAIRRLVGALRLAPDEVDKRQRQLASQYNRYLELRERFRDLETAG